ncbi:hypothetical protein PI95_020065 [Hassallia byssoidea VB512170]|uniref:Helicase C-terminal domain-containing protein n=1 Tax=Hassallia byssoidea VB512170 TaxID=1304833 RepID=A0A846HCW3_9CYAN|nr:helicase-related protein [Hassalia byssoidea]NEU74788.1 hypothetical protein [Hassalia byssoidea VB512170]
MKTRWATPDQDLGGQPCELVPQLPTTISNVRASRLVKEKAVHPRLRGYCMAIFYGSLTGDRRAEIIEQLQSGQIRFIISTEALEAGRRLTKTYGDRLQGFALDARVARSSRRSVVGESSLKNGGGSDLC